MTRLTIGFGLALVALGIAGYFGTGAVHPTALIPAAVGLVLVVFGILARNPKVRMHAMHGAAATALIGFIGSVAGVGQLLRMATGKAIKHPPAAIARSVMAILCLAFIALAVRSFVAARRARRGA
ncbi:MAG: hypothetical protein ABSB49_06405 [Polyangia bacterium]|jgi:hypothetical protein